ncbi:hypothetical protein [Afipia sp. DC4300-2b1]|jgi:hypothetical protein|uniref:hypothetical protein n=1 Tax=Afipia sp. DC4300-2b1 TaxID=2804672 RepID=UPI003CEED2E1
MKKLAIAFAVGAAALLGGSAANAADNSVKAQAATHTAQINEFSSQHRRHRHHSRHRHVRPYGGGYGYYAPQAYYAPQPYYYGGGPSIGFGFGGGHFGGHHGGHHGGHQWGHH